MSPNSVRVSPVIRPDTQHLFVKSTVEMSWDPGLGDFYSRPRHTIGALNFPMVLDNFLAICSVPGQVPFTEQDRVVPGTIVVGNFEFTATHHGLPICIFGEVREETLFIGSVEIGKFHHSVAFNPETNRLKVSQGKFNTGKVIELDETFYTPCGFVVRAEDLKDIRMGFYITALVTRRA